HPSGVGASARKSPFAGDAITTIDSECLRNARRWPPSEKGVGCAKDLACNFRGQETGGMRAHSRLCKTPGGARISRPERLDHLVESDEIDVAATHRDREQYMEKLGSMHGPQDIARKPPPLLPPP